MEKNLLFQEVEKIRDRYPAKKLVIYGAGSVGKLVFIALNCYDMKVLYFVDADKGKQGKSALGTEIKSPYDLLYENPDEILVILGLSNFTEAEERLNGMGYKKDINYYSMGMIEKEKPVDLFDPFLGFSRLDDIEGFKIFGTENAKVTILTLGGSTTDYSMSGICSWPYYLQKEYAYQGIGCKVINGGIGGYYSGQELLKLLRDGLFLNPDIVVSFSGTNDAAGTSCDEKHPMLSYYLRNTLQELPLKNKKIGTGYEKNIKASVNWLNNMRLMHAACQEFGIKFFSFLQPHIGTGNYRKSEKEKKYFGQRFTKEEREFRNTFYEEEKKAILSYSYIKDFTGIFDDKEGLYYDDVHCNEEGNQIIAKRIFEVLQEDTV